MGGCWLGWLVGFGVVVDKEALSWCSLFYQLSRALCVCVLCCALCLSSSTECQLLHWDAGHRQECKLATKKRAEKKAKKKAAKKEKKMAKDAIEEVN